MKSVSSRALNNLDGRKADFKIEDRLEASKVWRLSEGQGSHSGFCGQHQRSIHFLLRRNKENGVFVECGEPEVGRMLKKLRNYVVKSGTLRFLPSPHTLPFDELYWGGELTNRQEL